MIRHRVDGEIPAHQILLDARDKTHRIRVPPIGIAGFGAVGCDLDRHAIGQRGHRAVPQAGRPDVKRACQGCAGLLGPRRRG